MGVPKPKVGRATWFLLLNFPMALIGFVLILPLSLASGAASVVWIGLFGLMGMTAMVRGFGRMHRGWARAMLGVSIPTPYRALPRGLFRRWRAKLGDPATWRDLSYVLIGPPLAAIGFVLPIALWGYGLFMTSLPVWVGFLPHDSFGAPMISNGRMGYINNAAEALPYALIGLLLIGLAILVVPRLGQGYALLAKALLGPTRASELSAKAEHLQASRARGVDAAEAERRRIERDLHDGAQQRLVAVAMGLGRARAKLDSDPDAARELMDEAHADAKLAIAELRDLARGIYPAVLGDRGLDAALSALAVKSPVGVKIEVDVEPRPPTAVESTAYFIVGESLTNVAKHARATKAEVHVYRQDDGVVVEIVDDGVGGAEMTSGGGLAGLADRAATIDGVVTVLSPVGGPTVVRAVLPCEW